MELIHHLELVLNVPTADGSNMELMELTTPNAYIIVTFQGSDIYKLIYMKCYHRILCTVAYLCYINLYSSNTNYYKIHECKTNL